MVGPLQTGLVYLCLQECLRALAQLGGANADHADSYGRPIEDEDRERRGEWHKFYEESTRWGMHQRALHGTQIRFSHLEEPAEGLVLVG